MKFSELGLSKPLLNTIAKMNYDVATEIQSLAIPYILQKRDVIGIAQTGTGKTAAFSLPILENLLKNSKADKKIKVLILSPTRELALQIRDNIRFYGSETDFKCSVVLGGVNQQSQIKVLKNGIDILVATPGRLLDLMNNKHVDLSNVNHLVLDEADTMLDMGFIRDVRKIVSKTPKNRQTLLFSATMSNDINKLSDEFLIKPVTAKVAKQAITVSKIKQLLYKVDKHNKSKLLFDILKKEEVKSALIFTRTKHGANKLEKEFILKGIKCSVIHGNKSQNRRVQSLSDFKTGVTNIMIATDIAARGIDINELSHVINYDVPEHPEVYVHRIGRTARAGLEGTSITFCCIDEVSKVKDIERLIKQNIEEVKHNYPMEIFTITKKPPRGGSSRKPSRNQRGSEGSFDRSKRPSTNKLKSNGTKKTTGNSSYKGKDSNSFKGSKGPKTDYRRTKGNSINRNVGTRRGNR